MMTVSCTNCGAAYRIDESKIPASGGAITCQNCKQRFVVQPQRDDDATVITPMAAIVQPESVPPQSVPPESVPPQSVPPEPVPPQFATPQVVPPQFLPPQSAPAPLPSIVPTQASIVPAGGKAASTSGPIALGGAKGAPVLPPVPAFSPPPSVSPQSMPALGPAPLPAAPLPAAPLPTAPLLTAPTPAPPLAVQNSAPSRAPVPTSGPIALGGSVAAPATPVVVAPPVMSPPTLAPPLSSQPSPPPSAAHKSPPPFAPIALGGAASVPKLPDLAPSASILDEEMPPNLLDIPEEDFPPLSTNASLAAPKEEAPPPAVLPPSPIFESPAPANDEDMPDVLQGEAAPKEPPRLTPPEDLPATLNTSSSIGDDLLAAVEDDDLPPPLEAQQEEYNVPEPLDLPPVGENARDEGNRPGKKTGGRKGAMIGGVVVLVLVAGVVAFRFTTGAWPFAAAEPTPVKKTKPVAAVQKTVPPAPDAAQIDSADLDALSDALSVLDERAKALAEKKQPIPESDQSLRLKILWHGAVLDGAKDFADQLQKLTATLPEQNASPDAERAQAAAAYLSDDDSAANKIIQRLLARDKGDPEALLLQGCEALRAGDGAAAAKSFDAVLVTRPKSIDAVLGLADAADAAGDDQAVNGWLKQANTLAPANPRVRLQVALHDDSERELRALDADRDSLGERDQGKLDYALSLLAAKGLRSGEMMTRLQAAAAEAPQPEYWRRLGWLQVYQKQLAPAEQSFSKAEALDKSGAYAETIFLGRAQVDLRRGDADAVQALITRAQKMGVPGRSTQLAAGWLAEAQGKLPQAAKAYALALKADKNFSWAFVSLERASDVKAKSKVRVSKLVAASKKFPDARVAVATGDAYLDDGNEAAAAERYEFALQSDPWAVDYPAVVARYSQALTKSGRATEAARIAMLSQPVDPKDAQATAKAANIALAANDADTAGELADAGLSEHENDTALLLILADVQLRQNQREKSRETLQHVLKINDNLAPAHAFLAKTYYPADPDVAKLHIKRAIEIDPKNANYHFFLGQTYAAKEKWQEAKDAFSRAIEIDPKNASAHVELGRAMFQLGDQRAGVKELQDALLLAPDRGELYAQAGAAYYDLGDRAKATQVLTAGLKRSPNSFELLAQLGKISQEEGNRGAAMKYYQAATKARPSDANAHLQLGYLYKDGGQNRAAIAEFEQYLRLNPKADDARDVAADIADLQK